MIFRALLLCFFYSFAAQSQAFVDLLDEFTNESIPPEETVSHIVIEEAKPVQKQLPQEDPISQLITAPRDKLQEFEARVEKSSITLQGLDTETGRVYAINAPVGQTIEFGTLRIQVKKCLKNTPGERAESVAFLVINEHKEGQEPTPYFSGWMFSTSPSLSALDHPVFDVWVKECID